ncbi:hypothetical protein Avbf_14699 [Armadillidium vulgare]|nr:hypothetical protein Avbf_14699 [Armadillidium vulgare]
MDIKCEAEFKVELLESSEDDDQAISINSEQLSVLQQIQEGNCSEFIDVKSEIEIKFEPLDVKDENTANDEHFDNICELDQNQIMLQGLLSNCTSFLDKLFIVFEGQF